MLSPTNHARRRIGGREICDDHIAAALAGNVYRFPGGKLFYYDPGSRCTLVVDSTDRRVITAFYMTRRQAKRTLHKAKRVK